MSISIEEIKTKFQSLQSEHQRLREEKVRFEAQLATLQNQYDEQVKALLEETKTTSLEEAATYLKKQQAEIEQLKSTLQTELDSYTSLTISTR